MTRPSLVEVLVSTPSQTAVERRTGIVTAGQPLSISIKGALVGVDDNYQQLIKQYIDPLFGATRRQQIETMREEHERIAITSNEKALNRNIAIALVLTGTALTAGHALAPIMLVCFPLAIYISRVPLQRAYISIFYQRRLTLPVVASINLLGTWLGGFYVAGGLGFAIFYLAEKLIFITEDNSRQRDLQRKWLE